MTALAEVLALTSALPTDESYTDLLRSGPHWLFELTLELLSAPLAFAVGWLWRNGLLRHMHRDLHALAHNVPSDCVELTSSRRVALLPRRSILELLTKEPAGAPAGSVATRDPVARFRHERRAARARRAETEFATRHDVAVLAAQVQALRDELHDSTARAAKEAERNPPAGPSQPPA